MSSWTRRDVPDIGTGPEVGTLIVYDQAEGMWFRLGTAGDDHLVIVAAPAELADDDQINDWLLTPEGDRTVKAGMPGWLLAEFAKRPGLARHADVTPEVAAALAAADSRA